MQRKSKCVNVSECLWEASNYNFLILLGLVLTVDLKVVPESASSLASDRNSTISGQRHVHVQGLIRINSENFIHLILDLVQQTIGEVIFDLGFAVKSIVQDNTIRVACNQVLIVGRELEAGDPGWMVPHYLNKVLAWLSFKIKNAHGVVQITTNVKFVYIIYLEDIVEILSDPLIS
jgi:hypothetical protein